MDSMPPAITTSALPATSWSCAKMVACMPSRTSWTASRRRWHGGTGFGAARGLIPWPAIRQLPK
jgi:hypothetical protein